MADNLEAILNAGIQAARAGRKAEARQLLEQVVAQNDRIERAWLALASVVDATSEKRNCLQKVLELNPANDRARQALLALPAEPRSGGTTGLSTRPGEPPSSFASSMFADESPSNLPAVYESPADYTPYSSFNFDAPAAPPSAPSEAPYSPRTNIQPKTAAVPRSAKAIKAASAATAATTARAGTQASVGAKQAWRSQRNQEGFRFSIPFITIIVVSVLALIAGVSVIISNTPSTPLVVVAPSATLSTAQVLNTKFPSGTPTATAIGTIVTPNSEVAVDIPPTWTPSPTPAPSATPLPLPTRRPVKDYVFLYNGDRAGRKAPGIYLVGATDTREYPVVMLDDGAADPSYSPDGSQIVYVANSGPTKQLFVADFLGREPRQVTQFTSGEVGAPTWSPDGTALAFAATLDTTSYEIYTIKIDGSALTRITDNKVDDLDPSWSPDGTQLVWASDIIGRRAFQIVARTLSQTAVRQLTESSGSNLSPAFSPDGSSILFSSTRDRNADVYIMRADGTDERLISFDSDAENRYPSWSSDGAFIVFTSTRNGGVENIFVMRPDGKNIEQITNEVGASYKAKIRPNGF